MKCILSLLFIASSFVGLTQTPTEYLTFSKDVYTIKYPKSWKMDTSKIMGADLFFFSPLESATDKFSDNVNVLIQDLNGQNIDLEKYKDITEKQLADMATDGKIYESTIITSGATRYFKITYTMRQGKFDLRVTSLCFIKKEKAYLVTFTAEQDKYDSYKEVGEFVLNSFILLI